MCFDGGGGSILAVQSAFYVRKHGKTPIILCPHRDEVFKPFKYLFKNKYECVQVPESHPDLILKSGKRAIGLDDNDEIYLIYPDGLYLNPFAFDYKKYKTTPQTIKSTRVLTDKFDPLSGHIYIGLISSTSGYLYHDIPALLTSLSEALPDCKIHTPIIDKWAGKDIDMGKFEDLAKNIILYKNPDFISQIDLLSRCEYGIYTDNGPSHISYALGQTRLLLDPYFGLSRQCLPFIARWREDREDSVRIDSCPKDIARTVKLNLKYPQTTLIPRNTVLLNPEADWPKELLFKF